MPPGTKLLPDGNVLASDGKTFVRIESPKRRMENCLDDTNDAGRPAHSERQPRGPAIRPDQIAVRTVIAIRSAASLGSHGVRSRIGIKIRRIS